MKQIAGICTCYLLLSKGKKAWEGSAFLLINFSAATLCHGFQMAKPFIRELWVVFPTDCWSNCLPALATGLSMKTQVLKQQEVNNDRHAAENWNYLRALSSVWLCFPGTAFLPDNTFVFIWTKNLFPLWQKWHAPQHILLRTSSSPRRLAFVKRGCCGAALSVWKSELMKIYCS